MGDDLARAHLVIRHRDSLKEAQVKRELVTGEYNGNKMKSI